MTRATPAPSAANRPTSSLAGNSCPAASRNTTSPSATSKASTGAGHAVDRDVCTEFAISPERVYQWHARRKIKPTREEGRTKFWLPWDVFCLLNPAIREALGRARRGGIRMNSVSTCSTPSVAPRMVVVATSPRPLWPMFGSLS